MIARLLILIVALLTAASALAQSSSATVTSASGSNIALVRQAGTSLPATCSVGQLFFKSNATAGQNIYQCATANTWTQEIGGTGTIPLTSARIFVGNSSNIATGVVLSGDCTMANTGAITCAFLKAMSVRQFGGL